MWNFSNSWRPWTVCRSFMFKWNLLSVYKWCLWTRSNLGVANNALVDVGNLRPIILYFPFSVHPPSLSHLPRDFRLWIWLARALKCHSVPWGGGGGKGGKICECHYPQLKSVFISTLEERISRRKLSSSEFWANACLALKIHMTKEQASAWPLAALQKVSFQEKDSVFYPPGKWHPIPVSVLTLTRPSVTEFELHPVL